MCPESHTRACMEGVFGSGVTIVLLLFFPPLLHPALSGEPLSLRCGVVRVTTGV